MFHLVAPEKPAQVFLEGSQLSRPVGSIGNVFLEIVHLLHLVAQTEPCAEILDLVPKSHLHYVPDFYDLQLLLE